MQSRYEKRSLPVKLTDEEHIDRGRAQADQYKEYCAVEAKKKADNEVLKERLDAARKEMERLSVICKTGFEPRQVDCRWEFDYASGQKTLIRQDTGEVVEGPVTIPVSERQGNLLS